MRIEGSMMSEMILQLTRLRLQLIRKVVRPADF